MQDMEVSRQRPHETFGAICAESGFLGWTCSAVGDIADPPPVSPILFKWICSPALSAEIIPYIDRAKVEGAIDPAELYPGCWLTAFGDYRSALAPVDLAMVVTDAAANGPRFHEICAAAGLVAAEVQAELAPFFRHGEAATLQALATIRRLHAHHIQMRREGAIIDQLSERLTQAYEELNLLFRLSRFMNVDDPPSHVVQLACNQLQEILPFAWTAALFKAGTQLPELDGRMISAGVLPCPAAKLHLAAATLFQKSAAEDWKRPLNPADSPLAAIAGGQVVAQPISHDGRIVGILLAGGKTGATNEASSGELQFLDASADFLAIFQENASRFAEQKALFLGTLRALTASVDAKDRYTCGHSDRVSILAAACAQRLGLSVSLVEQYRIAGLVHDVGKIGTPEAILTKIGRLTEAEFTEVKRHPQTGYRILKDIPALCEVLPGVLHHHERFDGAGYPDGLAGEAIPLIARVLALADTFDAMRSNRSYRSARSHEAAIAEIRRCAGTQFDPRLAQVFIGIDFTEFDRLLMLEATPPLAA